MNNTPRVPMLLRKDLMNRGNSIELKAPQSSGKLNDRPRDSVQKISHIPSNSDYLKMKGAEISECKKSVKKIKLISML